VNGCPKMAEVQYEEAKALAMELAPFRQVPAAMTAKEQRSKAAGDRWSSMRTDDRPFACPVEPTHYVKEMPKSDTKTQTSDPIPTTIPRNSDS